MKANACDDWGNPIKLSVSDGLDYGESNFADDAVKVNAVLWAQIQEKDARIKELSAALIDSRALYLLLLDVYPESPGWNLDDQEPDVQSSIRKQACESLAMEEPLMLLQLREQAVLIQKLEEAFLISESYRLAGSDLPEGYVEEAKEALEKIKQGDRKV